MSQHSARGRRWRTLTRWLRGQYEVFLCCRCGHPIDPDLWYLDRMALTWDHWPIPAELLTPAERLDPANIRPAHRRCNSSAGARIDAPQMQTSRRW